MRNSGITERRRKTAVEPVRRLKVVSVDDSNALPKVKTSRRRSQMSAVEIEIKSW